MESTLTANGIVAAPRGTRDENGPRARVTASDHDMSFPSLLVLPAMFAIFAFSNTVRQWWIVNNRSTR
jgi:hypothetical protein